MFKRKELECIIKSLNYSISNLETYLDKHKEYLSMAEKREILNQIEAYRNIFFKTDAIIADEEAEKILKQLEACDSSGAKVEALNT